MEFWHSFIKDQLSHRTCSSLSYAYFIRITFNNHCKHGFEKNIDLYSLFFDSVSPRCIILKYAYLVDKSFTPRLFQSSYILGPTYPAFIYVLRQIRIRLFFAFTSIENCSGFSAQRADPLKKIFFASGVFL